jgi:hypothetical protein
VKDRDLTECHHPDGTSTMEHSVWCDICGWGDTCVKDVETEFGKFDLCGRHKLEEIKQWVADGAPLYDCSAEIVWDFKPRARKRWLEYMEKNREFKF